MAKDMTLSQFLSVIVMICRPLMYVTCEDMICPYAGGNYSTLNGHSAIRTSVHIYSFPMQLAACSSRRTEDSDPIM